MEPLDFLAAVLPSSSGRYCTFTVDGKFPKNIFTNTAQELLTTTKQFSDAGKEAYFALSSFDASGYRKAENALCTRSFFMDLDCGKDVKTGKDRAFKSKKEALVQLEAFLSASGLNTLGDPWLVDSGGGVHVYFPLAEDVPVPQWVPVAEALKNAAAEHAFPLDTSVTADAARVLRLPGTNNNKAATPRPIVLRQTGSTFSFAAIRDKLASYATLLPARVPLSTALVIPGVAPKGASVVSADALAGNSITRFRTILLKTEQGTGCGQLRHYIDNASSDGMEPVWRGVLSWAKHCVDGEKAAKKLSDMHPYDHDRMYRKLNEIRGPYSCAAMDALMPNVCAGCRHWGRITNPLILGREYDVSAAEEVVIDTPNPELPTIQRPSLPRGFDYAQGGGIVYHKPAEKKNDIAKDILLTKYDLFLTNVFREGRERKSEFTVIKEGAVISFALDNSVVTNVGKLIAELAANNVFTLHGELCDTYLAKYVRACVADASVSEERVVNIPPRFGWQDDGSMAVGDMVYRPEGPENDYSFNSDNLQNVIHATRVTGDIAQWRRVFEMFRVKGAYGHLAIAMSGFASLLMRFMPKGTNASAVHVCQETSSGGKTLALNLAASICGTPKSYCVVADTSRVTMLQRAGLLGGWPLIVDEVTTQQRKTNNEWAPEFVFGFANGAHKIKGSHAGNSEVSHDLFWDALTLFTSNTPLLEYMVGARKHSSHGEVKRFLEWSMPYGYTLDMSEAEMAIYNTIFENCGGAGREFAKWCVRNSAEAAAICAKWRKHWVDFSGAAGDERFWTSSVAANLAACEICAKIDLIQIPISPIQDFWMRTVSHMRSVIDKNVLTAEDMVNRYIADNNGKFVRVQSGVIVGAGIALPSESPKGEIRGRIEYNTEPGYVDIYLHEHYLKQFCAEINRGYMSFVQELENMAVVRIARRDLTAGTKGSPLRVACVRLRRPIKDDDVNAGT